ncbi:uncharacterized protein C8R40DRAFT_1130188 [Lentinula edodes]|uniref:uncharacterized protein n=1 Tax=Lentinula edodes TaxID=5353 RepID=UPI001E8E3C4F|nr:uncharacterized protein C8R40DRAFT_1130188 [Lentinula edodes]KAH7869633.1 hypothetical protein C8R40DRAFT_1130188 [Lentinula edodes]
MYICIFHHDVPRWKEKRSALKDHRTYTARPVTALCPDFPSLQNKVNQSGARILLGLHINDENIKLP